MSIDHSGQTGCYEPAPIRQPARSGPALAVIVILLSTLLLSLSACTRDDAAAALGAAAIELKATLEPWGATARANAAALGEHLPAALATAKAPVPTSSVSPTAEPPADVTMVVTIPLLNATPPSATPTTPPTTAPLPTAPSSPTPLPTRTPLPTATATAAPPPALLDVVLPAESGSSGGTMALLPGGSFQMGASIADLMALCTTFQRNCQEAWFAPAEPVHPVTLAPFYMDSHEVTNEAFALFLNATGGTAALCLGYPCLNADESQIVMADGSYVVGGGLERRPAAGVTWYGAAAFCEWREARLPTEAEWEMAAGWDGAAGASRLYPWGDAFDGKSLNFCDANCQAEQANVTYNDGYTATAPVASYEAGRSPAGLYDMAGNVWEWVADWYDPAYYAVSPEENPIGPSTGEERVVRGGSWYDTGYFTPVAVRFPSAPANADKTLGFRCAADLP